MKTLAIVACLLVGVLGSGLLAQTQKPRFELTTDPSKHHQDLTLRVTPDQSVTFSLPTSNSPIRLDLAANAIGTITGDQPNPILRSATLFHNSISDSIFLSDGINPATRLTQGGVSFTNQPGSDGVRMTIAIGLSSKGISKQLEVSVPDGMSGIALIEVRISLWY